MAKGKVYNARTNYRRKRKVKGKGKFVYKKMSTIGRRMSSGPFPTIMRTKLLYANGMGSLVSGGVFPYATSQWVCNGMVDFDYTNVLGNKQPLYFDQLISSNGPYKRFMVNAYKTTITVMNFTDFPADVLFDPAVAINPAEGDVYNELNDRKGVYRKLITGQNNAKPTCSFSAYRSIKKILGPGGNAFETLGGNDSSDPTTKVYGSVIARSCDGVSAPSVRISVKHIFYVTLLQDDATSS